MRPPAPRFEIAATPMVSRTLSCGKMLTSWNERAMPSRDSRNGPRRPTSCPLKETVPALGNTKPVNTLTSVVLPAPFGPMIETCSPSPIVKLTPSSAQNAP